ATIERLRPIADNPGFQAILVAEPSCLSAIKDDWLTLKCRTPLDVRKRIASKCSLPEDFFARNWDKHPRRPKFQPSEKIILHGHCHQKALWGAETSAAALKSAFGESNVELLDSGCCGMAGSFGYTK